MNSNAVTTLLNTADWEALTYLLTIAFHIGAVEAIGHPCPVIESPQIAALIEVARRRKRHMPHIHADADYAETPAWRGELWE